jgi:hypothetical protein
MNTIDEMLASLSREDALILERRFQISKWVIHHMELCNMSVSDAADACGITIDDIRDILTCCSDVPVGVLAKLSALFGVSVITICEGHE